MPSRRPSRSSSCVGRVGDPAQDLGRDVDRDRDRQRPGVHQPPEIDAADELHDEEVAALLVAIEVEHRGDVRMVEEGRDARLVDEHLAEGGVAREGRLDALDRDRPRESLGAHQGGLEDLGHSAAPDPPAQLVPLAGPLAGHRARQYRPSRRAMMNAP
jgi:hypothetical protein